MKVPEKVFARSFVEVRKNGHVFSADAVGALQRWAVRAISSLDARRNGDADSWSGWCAEYRARRLDAVSMPNMHDAPPWQSSLR
jgi:hypothetical protein